METMSTLHSIAGRSGIDVRRYGRLLAKYTPKVIQTEDENEEALAVVESLMKRGDASLTAEEETLLHLLGHLIEEFERRTYRLPEGNPAGALQVLMDGRDLKAADLAGVLGSRAKVSEILSGKRAISKEQAKRLGGFFGVSPVAFI
jgi:HTH-type transcriptional regulator/antitoxin HigA